MMTSGGVASNSTTSIVKALEASPIPSVLLDATFRIIQVSASYLAFNGLIADECIGRDLYDLVRSKSLIPGPAALQDVLDAAVATKNVHRASERQATGRIYANLRVVPIFEQDTLLYLLLEVQDTTAEHEPRVVLNDQLDTNDTYRVLVDTVKDYA
jgi:osomolarity two-component system sensor histidine kinase TcsA